MGKELHVLIVEDSEEDALLLLRLLKRGGYDPIHERVETAEAMRPSLSERTWDLILADYVMPHFSAPAALATLKESGLDIPFIIVSGSIGEDIAVQAMKAGAHDYLMKNNLRRLIPAIEQELREAEVRRKLRKTEEELDKNERLLRKIMEKNADGIVLINVDGVVRLVNPTAEVLLGRSAKELVGEMFGFPAIGDEVSEIEILRNDGSRAITEMRVVETEWEGEIVFLASLRDVTARKQTEKALQESEKRYRQVVESATEIIYTVDVNGNFLYGNPAGLKVTGYSVEELEQLNYADLVLPDHRERVMQVYVKQLREKLPKTYVEFPFFNKGGEIIWFAQNSTLVIEGDKILGFHIIARDITERKKAEEALKRSELRYRAIVEDQTDLINRFLPDTTLTFVNEACCRYFGKRYEELVGKSFLQFVPEEDRHLVAQRLSSFTFEHPMITLEHRVLAPGGEIRWMQWTNRAMFDEHEKVVEFQAVGRDITDRKKAEELLKKSEQRYRTLVESSTDAILMLDLDRNIAASNQAFLNMFGYEKNEVEGRSIRIVHPSDDSFRSFGNVAYPAIRKLGFSRAEWELRHKNGTILPVETVTSAIRTPDGSISSYIAMIRDISERKQAQQALLESEQRFRNLIENAPDVIFTLASDGTVSSLNPAFDRVTGWSRSEWLNKQFALILHPDDLSRGLELFQHALKREKLAPFELRVLEKSGHYLTAEFTVTPQTQEGSIISVLGIARDITARKRAEEALKKSEETAKQLARENEVVAELGRIISSTLDIKDVYERFAEKVGKLVSFDRISINVLDYEGNNTVIAYSVGITLPDRGRGAISPLAGSFAGEAIRRRAAFLVQGGDTTGLSNQFPALSSALQAGLQSFISAPLISKDRVIGALNFHSKEPNAYTEKDVNLAERVSNQIAGAIANAQLFIERKKTEEALRKSEERFRQVSENAGEWIWEVDASGLYTYSSPVVEKLLGYKPEEIVRKKYFYDLFDPDSREELKKGAFEVFAKKEAIRGFINGNLHKNGNLVILASNGAPIISDNGEVLGYRGADTDITERVRAQEEKEALEEQLRQSQKMEAIGRLAGGIAHDFNNLLTIMKGYSQISVDEMKEDDPLRGNIEEIRMAADRATDLTRQLLAFSRRQVMEMRVLDVNELLTNLDKMLRRMIGEDIDFVTRPAKNLGKVKVDPGQMEQVIMNLVVNARDAMPGGGKLTIETANVELDEAYARAHIAVTPGRYVMISVSDTGVGMTPEVRDRVFEPFFTTKPKGKGTGLGLSTVYGIIKQSGGNIWVYSEPGKGTTFKIYLSCVEEAPEELKERLIAKDLARGSETILIVEDEEVVLKLAGRILRKQGYEVWEFSSGKEALRICKEQKKPIHLLLTDVVMPQMGGRQLADRLKELCQDFKVLYMSGYTDNAITHHGVLDKGVDYLQKPFTVEGLMRKVREVLDK